MWVERLFLLLFLFYAELSPCYKENILGNYFMAFYVQCFILLFW